MMRAFLRSLVVLASVAAAAPCAVAAPAVVELFTSQSCYTCPPAEVFLGEIARRPGVIALELHVDYWDELVYGASGKWKDKFSRHAFTERQRSYNRAIRGKNVVYTPQMVIGGRLEAVGTDRGAVDAAIAQSANDAARFEVGVALGEKLGAVTVAGEGEEPAKVWLVRYMLAETTRVAAGENKGKTLQNHNVVTEIREIGIWRGGRATFDVPGLALGENEGCAVIVQDDRPGPVLGAGLCKTAGS
jgi:hypothetical protein